VIVVDTFAGPGGWDLSARSLGVDPIGVELDRHACATRAAAGLRTVRADVAAFPLGHFPPVDGVLASPPCPPFSAAGKTRGTADLEALAEHAGLVERRGSWCPLPERRWADPRSPLVIEPLRWTVELAPRWIVVEQVPPVLGLWQRFGSVLASFGFSWWAGILNAADFGLAQTRRRAILIARRDAPACPPVPTHAAVPGEAGLFGPALAPWVTMGSALGWGAGSRPAWVFERPSTTIVGSFRPDLVAPPTYRAFGAPPRQQTPGAVAITLAEALTLQGFPPDFPVQGPKTARWLQVGNAVPPPLARAVLGCVGLDRAPAPAFGDVERPE